MARLCIQTEDGEQRSLELRGEEVTIGRSSNNTVSIPANRHLSRRHLSVAEEDGRWVVKNLGAKNGLFVNGQRVDDRRWLKPGDEITATGLRVVFQEGEAAGASTDEEDTAQSVITTSVVNLLPEGGEAWRGRRARGGRADALGVFLRLSRETARRRTLQELFQTILELALEASGAERGALLMRDGPDVKVQASNQGELPVSGMVRERVLVEGESVLVKNTAMDPLARSSETIVGRGLRSLLAVPLQTDQRVIGMIYLESGLGGREFTEDDLNLLTAMSYFAGIMIERERWEATRRELLLAKTAALQELAGKLAHEINNPLGALACATQTLLDMMARGKENNGRDLRAGEVLAQLRGVFDQSLRRMNEVIRRMQWRANLDRAEVQMVDLNYLLFDVLMARLSTPREETPVPDMRFAELPDIIGRPMVLQEVFTELIDYVVSRVELPGGGGRVDVWTRADEDGVIVEVGDNGTPLGQEEAQSFFEPGFRMEGATMRANSMYYLRSDLREQGGEIALADAAGGGVRFLIRLPLRAPRS